MIDIQWAKQHIYGFEKRLEEVTSAKKSEKEYRDKYAIVDEKRSFTIDKTAAKITKLF